MKQKTLTYFWVGFIVASISAGILYIFLRQRREILPHPLVITERVERPIKSIPDNKFVVSPDPLEKIRGIGPATAKKLNEAGILTYRQLASSSPEEIKQIVGPSSWDPAEWISEATKLTGMFS